MRCFIAVDMPKEIKGQIHAVQKGFEKYENITLVNTRQLHCTMLFLGDLSVKQIEDTKSIISATAASYGPLRCILRSIGIFPNPRYIRVIWTAIQTADHIHAEIGKESKSGASGTNRLVGIQKSLETGLEEMRIYKTPLEHRQEFVPHVTIGRVRNSGHRDGILREIEKNTTFTTGIFEINEIKLKESILSPGGPEYHDIATYKLREHT